MKKNILIPVTFVFFLSLVFYESSENPAHTTYSPDSFSLPYSGVIDYDGIAFSVTNQAHGSSPGNYRQQLGGRR